MATIFTQLTTKKEILTMKQIKDLLNNQLSNVDTQFIVKETDIKETKNNNSYLFLNIQDTTGTMTAKIWNYDTNQKAQYIKVGDILSATVNASEYNGVTSLVINNFDILEDADKDEFIPSAPLSAKDLESKIGQIIDLIGNETLHSITRTILDNHSKKFFTQPAATNMHHEFKGGLAFHTFTMLQAANFYLKIYPFLNKDLMYAGIILHDLGKVIEINDYIDTSKTFKGELLGHINIINELITETLVTPDSYDDILMDTMSDEDKDLVTELKHIVLSHHGELEWGSNVTPRTAEAQIIHYIDQIDAKMMMFQKAFGQIDDGFTSKVFGLHNNKLYKRDE